MSLKYEPSHRFAAGDVMEVRGESDDAPIPWLFGSNRGWKGLVLIPKTLKPFNTQNPKSPSRGSSVQPLTPEPETLNPEP